MKQHHRTRSPRKLKAAFGGFRSRNQPVRAGLLPDRRPSKPIPAPRATPIDINFHRWPLHGVPELIIHEGGTVTDRPIVTLAVDEYTRIILGWHMS
jgi:transposase InsO family protein